MESIAAGARLHPRRPPFLGLPGTPLSPACIPLTHLTCPLRSPLAPSSLIKAGLLPALEARLAPILAAGTSRAALAAAVAAHSVGGPPVPNTLMSCTVIAMRRSDAFVAEVVHPKVG